MKMLNKNDLKNIMKQSKKEQLENINKDEYVKPNNIKIFKILLNE